MGFYGFSYGFLWISYRFPMVLRHLCHKAEVSFSAALSALGPRWRLALQLFSTMGIEPNVYCWNALISSCRLVYEPFQLPL